MKTLHQDKWEGCGHREQVLKLCIASQPNEHKRTNINKQKSRLLSEAKKQQILPLSTNQTRPNKRSNFTSLWNPASLRSTAINELRTSVLEEINILGTAKRGLVETLDGRPAEGHPGSRCHSVKYGRPGTNN